MKNVIALLLAVSLSCFAVFGQTEKPLRIFIRAGPKTHGPGQHDGPSFLRDWKILLAQRGAKVDGAIGFPTADQLANTDVLVMYAQSGGSIPPAQRAYLDTFLKRGGGMVVIHDSISSDDPDWYKTIVGGAWANGRAGFFEGDISLYYLDHSDSITRDASNFDFDDEMYYHLDMMPEAHILAGTYTPDERNKHDGRIYPSVYDVSPQMWTYETNNHRAFVCIPGHTYKSFSLPHFRAVLLRGIAWAGKRDADLFVTKEELASLTYPEGGPTRPEDAAKKIVLPPDFNINLVAAEPLIEKPISMDWDPKGRLWIAETPEYPFRKDRSRAPYDRISILEDTKHTGRMDKKTVFYEGLDLVTSMVFYRDGVIVSQAPYIYWLRDTKGKGKADQKTLLYQGFGTNDTHAVINNLRWGFDGWIYATLGYTKGDIYSADGKTHFGRVSEGVIRFKPDGTAMEQVSSKGGNTWGVDIAPDGEIFYSQANGNHIDHVVMPESVLARGRVGNTTSYQNIEDHNRSFPLMAWQKQAYVQIDWVGNFTAAAGACIYDGGAWPEKYNYTYYVAEPTINIVHQDILTPKGTSYVASKDPDRLEKEFIASSDLWFRPIHQRVGPDGALYVLDFYNQAAVHNDTRGPRHDPQSNAALRPDRDHYFGRIWRIQHKDAKKLDVPRLDRAKPAELVKALEHPNEWVRGTALRLIWEHNHTDIVPALEKLAKSETASAYARIHAFWALADLKQDREENVFNAAINSPDTSVRKSALDVLTVTRTEPISSISPEFPKAVLSHLDDPDARVRLKALIALQTVFITNAATASKIVELYPTLKDPWLESAFLGVAQQNPDAFIAAAFNSANSTNFADLITQLASQLGDKQNPEAAAHLVITLADKPAAADPLKQVALDNLSRNLRPEVVPQWSDELQRAFHSLLSSPNPDLATAALPLATRWDKNGSLAPEIKTVVQQLTAKFNDPAQLDPMRARLVPGLLAARQLDPQILPSVAGILGSGSSPVLQKQIIEALGKLPDSSAGSLLVAAYPKLSSDLQDADLNQLVKRSDWTMALLDAMQANKINLGTLGPVAINRLRTHNDPAVAARANKIIDEVRGPETKEKDALIAKFTPIVTQPGDAVRGKQLFTQNCAVCHRFNGAGNTVAPDLTGMGAHGPAELIIHVLDPNREVEPNYYAYSVETRDGETYNGVIASENSQSLTLRNASGDVEIKIADIVKRRNTGLSLMPNGFESLGGETLRDILAYLCAGESNYRILDLRSAFTANSDRGMWVSETNLDHRLDFRKFGLIKVDDIPFEIVNPLKAVGGKNVIVLKGGSGFAQELPQRVEVRNVGVKATRLDFLGGVGGWAYPIGGDKALNLPVAKITVHYADQQNEEFILKNGVEIADWIGDDSVPGSKPVPRLVKHGQVRWFSKPLKHQAVIQSITLESFNNMVAPTFVAITAETGDRPPETAAPAADAGFKWGEGNRVLIVGGGSSHDFNRWFNQADVATLSHAKNSVNYTDQIREVLPALKDISVLYLCNNQPMPDPQLRQAVFDFADAGHGLLLVHPAVWYNWKDWPEYNRVLVGGGTSGHDKYGEFSVTVTAPDHPIMAGVPHEFKLSDELYHFEPDSKGTPIEVLAEGKSPITGKTWPLVWIVKHPHARIVCITLGHDTSAHDLLAYQTLLQNAAKWAAGK